MATSMRSRRKARAAGLLGGVSAAAPAFTAVQANAQMNPHEWTGAVSTDCFDPENWGVLPTQLGNDIVIVDDDTRTAEIISQVTLHGLISVGATDAGSLSIESSNVTATSVFSVGGANLVQGT